MKNNRWGGVSQTAFEIARRVFIAVLALSLGATLALPGVATADEPQSAATAEASAASSESTSDDSSDSSSDSLSDASNGGLPSQTSADSPDAIEPAAQGKVTMQQGAGKAKGYDSISAALADVADYHYKNNKEAYVITLNSDINEFVAIPANKKVTIDLNGKWLDVEADGQSAAAALIVRSKYATVKNSSSSAGGINSSYCDAVLIEKGANLTVSGCDIAPSAGYRAIVNNGTLTMKSGYVKGGECCAILNSTSGTATISGGTVSGEYTAIRNDGKLTVNGGSVESNLGDMGAAAVLMESTGSLTVSSGQITSGGVAVAAYGTASVTVSGGSITGETCGVEAYGAVKINISSGSLSSDAGCSLSVGSMGSNNAVAVTISGGEFTSASGKKSIDRTSTATVTLSGGTFNVASAADVCDSPVFVDRYSAVEKDGKIVVEMTRPAAVVIAEDGTQTAYDTFTKACSNAPAYSTVKLMEDAVLGKYAAEVNAYGVTVDLNGFNIDGTAYTGSKAALTLKTPYGDDPVDGKDSTLRLINGKPDTGGKVTAKLPVAGKAGDSTIEVPIFIGEEVELAVANGGADKVKLESSAYLVYTEKTASFFSNGGFKADASDGTQRVYGTYSSAAKYAAEGSTVVMLNDFTGNDTIYSGDKVATLDLGGHTYAYTGTQQVLYINYDNAGIILKNGTIVATQALSQAGVAMLYSGGTFTMDHVVMNISGESWGIGTNGTNVDNTIVLKDSTLNVPEGLGIYFPSTGSVTIDNSAINAKHFGVQVCAGDLIITGDKTSITATGAPQEKTGGDGPIIDGAAVSVVEREGYQNLGAVAIEGGTFTASDSSKAVKTYMFNNIDRVEGEWPDAGSVVAVSGGMFSDPIDDAICADGFAPQENADGTFGVHEHRYTIAHSDAEAHWTECEICGAVTDKQAHAFTVADHDAESHWMKCEGCDATTEKAAHSFEWVVDKDATETESGSKHEECTECGFAKAAIEIPATGTGSQGDGDSGNENKPTDDGNRPGDGGNQSDDGKDDPSGGKSGLPSTGDGSLLAPMLLAIAACGPLSTGIMSRRRRER